MNPAIVIVFSCMAVLAQGAAIVDPTRAPWGLFGGASGPLGSAGAFGANAWPFSLFGSSRATLAGAALRSSAIGGLGFGAEPFGTIGARAALVEEALKSSAIGGVGFGAEPFGAIGARAALAGGALRSSAIGGLGFGGEPFSTIGARAAIAMDAAALSPFGIEKLGLGAGPFDVVGDSRCIGEACIFAPVSKCIGGECANVLAENQVRQVEVQKQLQDQLELQNAQFVQQQQLLNEQKRLQQERILSGEAALTQQAVEQEAQLEEQRAFVDAAQRLQRAQLLEQMKTAQINLAASKGLWNSIRKTCTAEGCFLAPNSFMSPLVAGVF
ncbi:unnamed protein product [Callosobruchus maculatus]|uniref:Uncharacterized protein n=1 Tax=Callosobruchus maculatus TaxID=64391 RepID=A0A653D013_CALMS|nr:unnamed protein product [Callosobruchus maculatus]